MELNRQSERLVTLLLFVGLFLNLFFIYFAQERLYSKINTGDLSLGPEKYLRILSVVFIFATVILSLFVAKTKYHFSIYFAYIILLVYITLNYVVSGADLSDMTQFMDSRGIGTWVCLGLIFTSYEDKRFRWFNKFLFFSVVFITLLAIYNISQFGIGLWRGQALSKYQVYTVNFVWIAPYVFLILKHNKKLKWLRILSITMGIVLALITQTRSFLLIYAITIAFDFFNTKNKATYTMLIGIGFIGFAYLVLNTKMLSTSFELLINRGIEDTRSEQLAVFVSQLNFIDIITGGGFFTSYRFGRNQWYFVDNQWLYLLWWGGIIPVITYFYLCAIVPIKLIFRGGMDYETKVECFVLIIWVLALSGLAIFSTMSVDFFFFTISIILGRVLYKYSLHTR